MAHHGNLMLPTAMTTSRTEQPTCTIQDNSIASTSSLPRLQGTNAAHESLTRTSPKFLSGLERTKRVHELQWVDKSLAQTQCDRVNFVYRVFLLHHPILNKKNYVCHCNFSPAREEKNHYVSVKINGQGS
jgi:hypothetical protein